MIEFSNKDIRAAIRKAGSLPADAALEIVDVVEQWQKTAMAGHDACLRLEGEIEDLRAKASRYDAALALVLEQAEDGGLWDEPVNQLRTIHEAYALQELRRLHKAIEGEA